MRPSVARQITELGVGIPPRLPHARTRCSPRRRVFKWNIRHCTRVRGAIQPVEVNVTEPPKTRTVSEMRIYSWSDWEEHRKTVRYLRHLQAVRESRIVRGLLWPVTWVSFVACALGVYETVSGMHLLSFPLPRVTVIYKPFEITSFALALLLVFRTDASYARFLSARDNWRVVISETRELMRLGSVFFGEGNDDRVEQLRRWTVTYAWCMRDHLLPPVTDMEDRLRALLTEKELAAVMEPTTTHKPNLVLAILTELINQVELESGICSSMLTCVERLETVVADCERILKTPIPLSYTRHTSRFLISYLTFLPFALWEETSWGVVPISGAVAFFMLGIDEIGVQIEEPFSIMPLERYCATIQEDAQNASKLRDIALDILKLPQNTADPLDTEVEVSRDGNSVH